MHGSTICPVRIRIKDLANVDSKVISHRDKVTESDANYLTYVSLLSFLWDKISPNYFWVVDLETLSSFYGHAKSSLIHKKEV